MAKTIKKSLILRNEPEKNFGSLVWEYSVSPRKKRVKEMNKITTTKYNAFTPRLAPFFKIRKDNNAIAGRLTTCRGRTISKRSLKKLNTGSKASVKAIT